MEVNRRTFVTSLFASASVATVLAGQGAWASEFFKPDPEVSMKARGLELLEIGGQKLFQLYGASGGLCAEQVFYLYKPEKDRKFRVVGVRLGLDHIPDGDIVRHCSTAVLEGIRQFDKHSRLISEGDDMGAPISVVGRVA